MVVLTAPKGEFAASVLVEGQMDRFDDFEEVRQQIKDEEALPVITSRSAATKKAYCLK